MHSPHHRAFLIASQPRAMLSSMGSSSASSRVMIPRPLSVALLLAVPALSHLARARLLIQLVHAPQIPPAPSPMAHSLWISPRTLVSVAQPVLPAPLLEALATRQWSLPVLGAQPNPIQLLRLPWQVLPLPLFHLALLQAVEASS